MSGPSLEEERKAILERMQMRRESYRRALAGGDDLARLAPPQGSARLQPVHAQQLYPTQRPVPTRFPRSTVMRVLVDHPLLCALGVAAVVAIGPRRIARTVAGGAGTVGNLATGSQRNIDMLAKVMALAGAYMQGRAGGHYQPS